MILNKITIKHFKSIYDEVVVDFSDVNGFWKIEGPVGAGKTTIGEAIIIGLFGDIRGKNNADLISWGSKKKPRIIIECTSKGHSLIINRTIRGDLSVLVDGEPLTFTNKNDAQHTLETEYYDVSRMTLELLCIISFNNFKSLINLSPKETRAFLDQVFGFEMLSQYAELCKNHRSEAAHDISSDKTRITALQSQITKLKDIASKARVDGTAAGALDTYNTKKAVYDTMLSKHEQELSDKRSAVTQMSNELATLKMMGANKTKEIEFIEQGTCPTCGSPIDQSQLDEKKKERDVLRNQYIRQKKALDDAYALIDKFNSEFNSEFKNPRYNELVELHRKYVQLEEQEKRMVISDDAINELTESVKSEQMTLDAHTTTYNEWDQLHNLLSDDMRQCILSSFIPSLNESVQHYTRQLQLPYTVEFDNQFKCTIRAFNIDEIISIASLSTGQMKTLDMCVILGVVRIIFSSIHFNVMFLDELFSNLDSELRAMICHILRSEISGDKTIFIISHQEISDAQFDGTIRASLRYNDNIRTSVYDIQRSMPSMN